MDTTKGVGDQITEEDVRLWLVESDEDAERAIRWIHDNYGARLLHSLNRWIGRAVDLSDKRAAIHEAYHALWEKGRNGDLDIDRPVFPFLLKVAKKRVVDVFRGETRKKRTIPDGEHHEELMDAVNGTKIGSTYRMLESRDLLDVVTNEFRAWLSSESLKGRQLEVAYCQAGGFPDFLGPEEIHEILLNRGGSPPTYEAVKRAREIVLNKFREMFERKYGEIWK